MRFLSLLCIISITGSTAYCQVDHLNRSDSGKVLIDLNNYTKFVASGDNKEASRMMDEIAFIYWNHNDPHTAISYYERSLQLNANIENENGIAMIHNNLGMLYNDIEDYPKALYHFKLTLSTRRAKNEPTGIISALVNLSVICNNLKKFDESIADLQEALSLSRQINDSKEMSSVYAMLSETYEKKGDVDESMKYFQLFKSFHDLLQKKEITKLSGDLEKDSLQSKVKELELQKKALEVKETQYELDSASSLNKSLYSNLSRKEIEVELLTNQKKLQQQKDLIAEERNRVTLQRKNFIRDILLVISIFLVAFGGSLVYYNKRMSAKNRRLLEQNTAIEKQRNQLEDANLVKTKIFSIIAHDLRSPLNSVQGFFNVIHLFEVSEELKQVFGKMERDITNMANVLDTLLNWSLTQLHDLNPQLQPVELSSAVKENVDLLQPIADRKSIQILNNMPGDLVCVTDLDMTKITLRNLVQNALKFTRPGGIVNISGRRENGSAYITVSDNGIGMSSEKIDSLFSFKSNESTDGTFNEKGTGLGMVLCAEMVKLCKGEIIVNSELNKGTSITLKFNTHA